MLLIDALRLSHNPILAFTGSGGKTTAIFTIARELSARVEIPTQKKTVLVTTTTHFGSWQVDRADCYLKIVTKSDLSKLTADMPAGIILLAGEESGNRLNGLPFDILEEVRKVAEEKGLPLLIEADGSANRPLKAPASHEPAIPEFADHVIVVAGLLGLGKQLTNEWVHRPEIFAELSGKNLGDEITMDEVVKVLCNNEGGLKNIPKHARRTILLNQADGEELLELAYSVSGVLLQAYWAEIIASLSKQKEVLTQYGRNLNEARKIHFCIERMSGIVLAAGASSRFGRPKQLLEWKGQPFLRHVVKQALDAGISPVIAMLGSSAEEIRNALSDLPVRIVINREWESGLSSSIRKGIASLPQETGAVLFMQADQPQTPVQLIHRLIEAHHKTLSPIIAPLIDGQRGIPVLFDRKT
jgi:molybdenum cofactor cytidylyltransferase